MALITRVSRLFRADLHAVLDRIEEPDVLLRQAIREMEDELTRDEKDVKLLNHQHGELRTRESDLDRSLSEIEEQLDVCFEAGTDDLARTLIKRRIEGQRLARVLSGKRLRLEGTLTELERRLEDNRARLTDMQQKMELLTEHESPTHPPDHWTVPDISVGDADVEVAFLQEKQKRSRP